MLKRLSLTIIRRKNNLLKVTPNQLWSPTPTKFIPKDTVKLEFNTLTIKRTDKQTEEHHVKNLQPIIPKDPPSDLKRKTNLSMINNQEHLKDKIKHMIIQLEAKSTYQTQKDKNNQESKGLTVESALSHNTKQTTIDAEAPWIIQKISNRETHQWTVKSETKSLNLEDWKSKKHKKPIIKALMNMKFKSTKKC